MYFRYSFASGKVRSGGGDGGSYRDGPGATAGSRGPAAAAVVTVPAGQGREREKTLPMLSRQL